MIKGKRKPNRGKIIRASVTPAYVHGDGAAARYLGFSDLQGRTFRAWAREMKIPFAPIGGRISYRIADLDAAWERAASKERSS